MSLLVIVLVVPDMSVKFGSFGEQGGPGGRARLVVPAHHQVISTVCQETFPRYILEEGDGKNKMSFSVVQYECECTVQN